MALGNRGECAITLEYESKLREVVGYDLNFSLKRKNWLAVRQCLKTGSREHVYEQTYVKFILELDWNRL